MTRIFLVGALGLFVVSRPMLADFSHPPALAAFLLPAFALTAAAAFARVWCSLHIAGRKNKELVTTGPYSLCRNPLYLFSLVGAMGVGLATLTVSIPAVVLVVFALYYPAVIRREEEYLSARHGDSFLAYCRAVPRFWPSLTGWQEPETVAAVPAVFRRHLLSAMCFVLAMGLVVVVAAFKSASWWPAFFSLP